MATLTITGTAADDTIVITATGADSGAYSINDGPAVAFSGVTEVVVTGEDGNDTLTIVNPNGGALCPDGRHHL
jgi:outer membrane usher protein FimD/PapC